MKSPAFHPSGHFSDRWDFEDYEVNGTPEKWQATFEWSNPKRLRALTKSADQSDTRFLLGLDRGNPGFESIRPRGESIQVFGLGKNNRHPLAGFSRQVRVLN